MPFSVPSGVPDRLIFALFLALHSCADSGQRLQQQHVLFRGFSAKCTGNRILMRARDHLASAGRLRKVKKATLRSR